MYNYLYSIVPITELDARIPRLERLAEDVRSVNALFAYRLSGQRREYVTQPRFIPRCAADF